MSETKLASSGAQASAVPSYLECAQPNPAANRAPWYKNIAPVYVGIFLWFVFWSGAVTCADSAGGVLSAGVGPALLGLFAGAAICYALFYHVFGRFGQKTGFPLYIVGSSTFGATGGLILPGFLMGLLQFGWISVNVYYSTMALNVMFKLPAGSPGLYAIMVVWGVLGVIMGLKGIKYVAMISTWLPVIPAVILLVLLAKTIGGLGAFDPAALVKAATAGGIAKPAMTGMFVIIALITYTVGFTATAGAAGCDFGTNARNKGDVVMGGLVGVLLAIFVCAGLATVIVAGFYGTAAGKDMLANNKVVLDPIGLLPTILGAGMGEKAAFLLALCAFPSCCFSAIIAATAIKTTLPKINPWITCGIGCAVAEALAMKGVAAKLPVVFGFFGASFGPICGAMVAEYFMNKGRWTGPRAGFNPAGWIAWVVGFVIGAQPQLVDWGVKLGPKLPLSLVLAFFAGAIVYAVLSGMQSKVLPYPQADQQSAD